MGLRDARRIAVVGNGGAGKSTFSQRLGAVLDLPVVHLDREFWRPGWVAPPEDEWRARQERLVAADEWVLDGNYGGTFDLRFARADAVVWLDLHHARCLASAVRRSWRHRGRAVQADGCPERFSLDFYRWIWRYPVDTVPRLLDALAEHGGDLELVRLPSRRAADRLLAHLATGATEGGP